MKKLLSFFLALTLWPTVAFAPLEFDGIDDNVTFGDVNALDAQNKMSWSFWAWRGPFVSGATLVYMAIDFSFGPDNGWMIRPISFAGVTDAIEVTISNAGVGSTGTGPTGSFPTNTWNHYAIIYDGTGALDTDKLKILRNGVQLTLVFLGGIRTSIGDNAGSLRFTDGGTNTIRLSNFRMWKRVNTIAEMQSIYNSRLSGADGNANGMPVPDFAPRFDFRNGESASSALIVDLSPNGFNGVATNGANGTGMMGLAESILTGK